MKHLAEILTGTAILAGWLLITWALAGWFTWRVWPLSIGVLLLSAAGWIPLARFARDGLYHITRDDHA